MDEQPLAGQHAMVTGASRGIGAAIAGELARLGAIVTLAARTPEPLEARRADIARAHEATVGVVAADMRDEAAIDRAFACAEAAFGPVRLLVNNAGTAASAPFVRTSAADWLAMVVADLIGPALCIRRALPAMLATGSGRIVNIASTAGLKGYPYVAPYCAAKHGLIGLTRSLALETAHSGVTVNAVCPGFADTDLTRETVERIVSVTGRNEPEALAELTRHNPQGRLIDPREVATVVGWLCLPGSSSITGQAIAVAGGEVM